MFSLENLSVCSLYFSIISLLPSVFQYVYFSLLFISFSPDLSLSHSLALDFCFTVLKIFSPPLFVINQRFEQQHSVRGISREADEISGAHLLALYGDLLGWDKQQASHHSQPNRLPPACVYSYCTATTTAIRGGVAPGGLLCGRGSLTLLSGSLPSIRSRKQASIPGLCEMLMAQFLSLSLQGPHRHIYKIRLLFILPPHFQLSMVECSGILHFKDEFLIIH